jgi:RNA polymerase sigma factor (sigma-70 family)
VGSAAVTRISVEERVMTDDELVRQALSGDRTAYGKLVVCYTPLVRALCRARFWRADVVPDLVQETFTRGLQQLRTLQEPSKFGAWLLGIARNLCRAWRRDKENRRPCFSDITRDGPARLDPRLDPPAPVTLPRESTDHLMAEVRRLPCHLRETLLLYYTVERNTYQQVADLLNISPFAVNRRLTRARAILRRRLRP